MSIFRSWRRSRCCTIAWRLHAICQLKDFGAPGCPSRLEDGVRMGDGSGEQLLNPQSASQLAPCKATQIHRAKRADVATQAGGVARALDTVATNPPAACIPGTKFINHVDDHGASRLVRPRRQRRLDID